MARRAYRRRGFRRPRPKYVWAHLVFVHGSGVVPATYYETGSGANQASPPVSQVFTAQSEGWKFHSNGLGVYADLYDLDAPPGPNAIRMMVPPYTVERIVARFSHVVHDLTQGDSYAHVQHAIAIAPLGAANLATPQSNVPDRVHRVLWDSLLYLLDTEQNGDNDPTHEKVDVKPRAVVRPGQALYVSSFADFAGSQTPQSPAIRQLVDAKVLVRLPS